MSNAEKKVRVFGGIKTTADVHEWPFEKKVKASVQPVAKVHVAAQKKANDNMSKRDRALSSMLNAALDGLPQQPKKKKVVK